jgi:hypothetical protein
VIATEPSAIACARCNGRRRNRDDLYHLILPPDWTLDDIRRWCERGSTARLLHMCGVRIERTCVGCQAKEPRS